MSLDWGTSSMFTFYKVLFEAFIIISIPFPLMF
jgi:hypothetical protein